MLEQFTLETFAPLQGDRFQLQATPDLPLTLTLAEVTSLHAANAPVGTKRVPFSLLFLGPTAPTLPQQIYQLTHNTLGSFELFLVPLGPTQEGLRYEAIFT